MYTMKIIPIIFETIVWTCFIVDCCLKVYVNWLTFLQATCYYKILIKGVYYIQLMYL